MISDDVIDSVFDAMPGGASGFCKTWGYRNFARAILALREMPKWTPQFDLVYPEQSDAAIRLANEVAGEKGKSPMIPDAVRIIEIAEEIYKAELDGALRCGAIVDCANPRKD